jgi:hypothetical protein
MPGDGERGRQKEHRAASGLAGRRRSSARRERDSLAPLALALVAAAVISVFLYIAGRNAEMERSAAIHIPPSPPQQSSR